MFLIEFVNAISGDSVCVSPLPAVPSGGDTICFEGNYYSVTEVVWLIGSFCGNLQRISVDVVPDTPSWKKGSE